MAASSADRPGGRDPASARRAARHSPARRHAPLATQRPDIIPWGWGLNGAFSVVGATLAIFIAMNWGFSTALVTAAFVYATAAGSLQAS